MKIKKMVAAILLCGVMIGSGSSMTAASAEQERLIESDSGVIESEDVYLSETTEEDIQRLQSEAIESTDKNNTQEQEDINQKMETYVYDGEVFYEEGMSEYMRAATGKIDYTYWAIHEGAGFGDILEDGRNLDHLGIIMLKTGRKWKTAYCIHHNANIRGGHSYADIESYLSNTEKKELTGRALYYGFQFDGWTPDDKVVPEDGDKGKYTATQVMIWTIEKGWYTYDKNNYSFKINSKAINAAKTICAKSDQSPSGSSYRYFNALYADMQNHDLMPSFVERSSSKARIVEMGYDFNNKQYNLTITDENNILPECTISGMPSGLKVQKNGNKLILTSSSPLESTVTLKFVKKSFKPETAVTVWSDQDDNSYQQIGTYAEPDVSNITGYLKIETENTGKLKLIKKSSNQTLTEGNSCYSLEGAEYSVYTDSACTKLVGKLSTDQSGNSNVLTDLPEGTYYVKETKRPKGYKVDQEVHEVNVVGGKDNILEVTDVPLFSHLILEIEKLAADELEDVSRFPLTGTEFTVDFYPEQGISDGVTESRKPVKSWVMKVNEKISQGKTVYYTSLIKENLVNEKSDELYMDENGSIVLPLGTVTIRETASASDYKMEGYIEDNDGRRISNDPTVPIAIEISDDNGGAVLKGANGIYYKNLTWKVYNQLYKCSIQIVKSDTVSKPLSGVWFTLLDEKNQKIAEGQTDKDGNLSFENLIPGKYLLIETKTVDGQQLLKEPVEIQLPLELTEKEAADAQVDISQCVYDEKNKVYRLYDRVYEISNSVNFVLPMTGGGQKISDYLVLFGGLVCLSMAALCLIRKKESFSAHSFDNIT